MRLPRRVPWSSSTEIAQLCSWIYQNVDEPSSKIFAIDRLSAWKTSTALPQALESTLSLLSIILQDERGISSSSPSSTLPPPMILRQSYALALIRLVNGLVDPLQQGAYARSIASIAAQIGLPLWLVELRHASTHEDLPSLELLREAARDVRCAILLLAAMSWLLHNYFLPTLSPTNCPSTPPTLSPLSPLLSQYKNLLKMTMRDVSLRSSSKPELARILRDVDHWIVEAKVAASMPQDTQLFHEDERERWALERLCDALVGRGGLVPISKRKRTFPSQPLVSPAPEYVSLWSPLILHVHSHYPGFPSVLLSRIMTNLISSGGKLETTTTESRAAVDASYDHTLASWAFWIVERWGDDPKSYCDREDVIKELLLSLCRFDNLTARALLTALAGHCAFLRESVALLTSTIRPSSRISRWEGDSLETMSSRLSSLHRQDVLIPSPDQDVEMTLPSMLDNIDTSNPAKGWRLVKEEHGWKPCPVGVFIRTRS